MPNARGYRVLLVLVAVLGWLGLVAADGPAERLYVLVSPYNTVGPSSIVAFDIGADGLPFQAESYPAGGNGRARTSRQPLAADAGGRFLFAANNESTDLAAFRIDTQGRLAPVPGSPFPLSSPPMSLVVHPSMARLYVPEFYHVLRVYEFDNDGALHVLQEVDPGPYLRGVAVHPSGDFLYVVSGLLAKKPVRGYSIGADGRLTELAGSPFGLEESRLWELEISSDGRFLFAHDLDLGIFSFEIGTTGGLAPIAGSPFPVGRFSGELALTPDDCFLYTTASSANAVYGFTIAPDGSLTANPGSPFPGDYTAAELLPSTLGPRLYFIGRDTRRVTSYEVDPDGRLFDLGPQVDVVDPTERAPAGALLLNLALEIDLDVKPDSRINPVNPRSSGLLPVAVLGRPDLDVTGIDVDSLRLGPGNAAPAHAGHLDQVNGDGEPDLVLHFPLVDTGIACGDTEVSLSGRTTAGRRLQGEDVIATRGCR